MYCLSVVTTTDNVIQMTVSTYYADTDRECKEKMRQIAYDAIESGEWEKLNVGEWFMWLRDLKHAHNICFMQVAPLYKVRF